MASKSFPLLFCEAASSNQSDVLSWPTVCPDNFYGLDCGQMCECRNGARCHHITGACLCTAGWAGPHCILGNGSHIIKTGCEGGPHCSPSRHPPLKHNYDVFVNNYLYNETFPMTFLGMGTGGERRGDKRALWHTWFNWGLFWINAPTCLLWSTLGKAE